GFEVQIVVFAGDVGDPPHARFDVEHDGRPRAAGVAPPQAVPHGEHDLVHGQAGFGIVQRLHAASFTGQGALDGDARAALGELLRPAGDGLFPCRRARVEVVDDLVDQGVGTDVAQLDLFLADD